MWDKMHGLSIAVTYWSNFRCTESLGHAIMSAGVKAHDAGAWAKLLHVQQAQNFWANDQTVRELKGGLLTLQ